MAASKHGFGSVTGEPNIGRLIDCEGLCFTTKLCSGFPPQSRITYSNVKTLDFCPPYLIDGKIVQRDGTSLFHVK